jgi:cytochrome b subunit of formate dehydrogenase
MKKGRESDSLVSHTKIPSTCAHCHKAISQEYADSIHGVAASKGAKDSPVCTDCHREHNILSPKNLNSSVSAQNVSSQVCSPCHSSVRLSDRYGLASDRFKTFSDSFHGLADKAGSTEVANCASCHGVHNIKPSSDPTSMVNKSNLSKTCGKCHPGANEHFTIGNVHVITKQEPLLKWISKIYILMILGIVGGMTIHNILDFIKKAKHRIKVRRGLIIEEPVGRGLYVRMTLIERIQHISLMISFIVLVITGFMLRYPDAWWIEATRNFSESIFNLRGLLHRIAAVVITLAGVYHIYYVIFTERGRKLICDLLPRWSDFTDIIGVLMFNIGFSSNKPKLGRFSYVEKAEYWALIWGSVVMSVTGVILWFDNIFMGLITKLGWDVARTIHFYEAWLAALAIIVWHFYFVLLNPDVYPMNLAWLTGTLSESEMRDEHPLELEKIKKEEMKKVTE